MIKEGDMDMPCDNRDILIIENDSSWLAQFKTILKTLGEHRNLIGLDLEEFKLKYHNHKSYDDVDFIFVDLELGPGISRDISDTDGIDVVLPIIKEHVPWIPVACISRFISGDPRIIGDLSVSDFDGFYPKNIIVAEQTSGEKFKTHPDFNYTKWQEILNGMHTKRISNLLSEPVCKINKYKEATSDTELIIDDNISGPINLVGIDTFKYGISLLGLNGTKYSIVEVSPGFSGLHTCKLSVYGEDHFGKIKSYWFLKWGQPIRKLHEEVEAHKRMLSRGIDRNLQIPLLHTSVMHYAGIGYIAYAFEENATTGLTYILERGISDFEHVLLGIYDHLHSNIECSPVNAKSELNKWCSDDKLCNNKPMEVTTGLIHGDFHLRNILIRGNSPTVIDFAKSDKGPVCIDYAKLIIDIIAFTETDINPEKTLTVDSLKTTSLVNIVTSIVDRLKAKDDICLFEHALAGYAICYMKYNDVDETKRLLLGNLL